MALSPNLLEILRCPEKRTVLKLAEADVLKRIPRYGSGRGTKAPA